MTFEEFFKKKKINLALLNAAEPELFAEFRSHYNLMGEKSFDHTKKYRFNALRLKYKLPDEPKIEKVIIENPLAEQTITQSLTGEAAEPKLGFKPKFKMGANAKSAPPAATPVLPEETTAEKEHGPADTAPPQLGFKPKFKMGVAASAKPAQNIDAEAKETEMPGSAEAPESPEAKPAYKPRFQAKNIKPKPADGE